MLSSRPLQELCSGVQAPRVVQIPTPPTLKCKSALCIWPLKRYPLSLRLRQCGLKLASLPHASSQFTECSFSGHLRTWPQLPGVDKNACPPIVMRALSYPVLGEQAVTGRKQEGAPWQGCPGGGPLPSVARRWKW